MQLEAVDGRAHVAVTPAPAPAACSRPSCFSSAQRSAGTSTRRWPAFCRTSARLTAPGIKRADRRVSERELQRRRRERDAMAAADGVDPAHPLEHLGRRCPVVVGRALARPGGEDARVERPADQDADLLLDAERQQLVERALLQQRVAAGEQDAVEVGVAGEAQAGLDLVDADPDRLDHAGPAQPSSAG